MINCGFVREWNMIQIKFTSEMKKIVSAVVMMRMVIVIVITMMMMAVLMIAMMTKTMTMVAFILAAIMGVRVVKMMKTVHQMMMLMNKF